jgi:hypothetical protein
LVDEHFSEYQEVPAARQQQQKGQKKEETASQGLEEKLKMKS